MKLSRNLKNSKFFNKKTVTLACVCGFIFLSVFYLTSKKNTSTDHLFSFLENSDSPSTETKFEEKIQTLFYNISDKALYFTSGMVLESVSFLARLGWYVSFISPWSSTIGNECLFLSHLCEASAQQVLAQIFKIASPPNPFSIKEGRPSSSSWYLNQALLSQIPASSKEEKKLLLFLEKHWLSKTTGFYPLMVDWVCPCFGIFFQVHPETTSSYARNPSNKFSQTYKNLVENWKRSLLHPLHYPLILTRPFDLQEYLPPCLELESANFIEMVKTLALKMQAAHSQVIVDFTHLFPNDIKDRKEWLETWKNYRTQFSQACQQHHLNLSKIICIQRLRQEQIGGIRILPLMAPFADESHLHEQFLLEWISSFGLSLNRVELDRDPFLYDMHHPRIQSTSSEIPSKEAFVSYLDSLDQNWKSDQLHENLMIKGTLQVLKGACDHLSDETWNEILNSPTRSSIAQLCFLKIKDRLKAMSQEKEKCSFFDTMSQLEQIHADLSSLLEIFRPFSSDDFLKIYKNLLTSTPSSLQPLVSCGVHSSGMTSLAGIIKAVKTSLGTTPHVLFGENTYFECIHSVQKVSHATSIDEASEEAWKQVDLILAQFNPVLKRIDLETTEYKVERIAEVVRKALSSREEKPLTLALDCTLDFIDSPRVGILLNEFQKEIEIGQLNVICYRSGLKFDMFGMDNYCGAPFYMIHSCDSRWDTFNTLLTDQVLQTDPLSFNWFCLAYQCAAPQLERYRKQIFDNTRALLDKIPSRLISDKNVDYRIIPVEEGADPAFVDFKIFGRLHEMRGAILAGGSLYLKCLEAGHPAFFRPSIGLYHPNLSILFGKDCTTIRLTLGLDPAQIDALAKCFEMIDILNGLYN